MGREAENVSDETKHDFFRSWSHILQKFKKTDFTLLQDFNKISLGDLAQFYFVTHHGINICVVDMEIGNSIKIL